jgi:hypothetical protein
MYVQGVPAKEKLNKTENALCKQKQKEKDKEIDQFSIESEAIGQKAISDVTNGGNEKKLLTDLKKTTNERTKKLLQLMDQRDELNCN